MFVLYNLGYTLIGNLNRFDEFVDGNALGDCLITDSCPDRISASLVGNPELNGVIISGENHRKQAEVLRDDLGINLRGRPKKIKDIKTLKRLMEYK